MNIRNSAFNFNFSNYSQDNLYLNVLNNNVIVLNGSTNNDLIVDIGTYGEYPDRDSEFIIRGCVAPPGSTNFGLRTLKSGTSIWDPTNHREIYDYVYTNDKYGTVFRTSFGYLNRIPVSLIIDGNVEYNNWKIYPDVVYKKLAISLKSMVKVNANWFSDVANSIRYVTGTNQKIRPNEFISKLTENRHFPLINSEVYDLDKLLYCEYRLNESSMLSGEVLNRGESPFRIGDQINNSFYIYRNDSITNMHNLFSNTSYVVNNMHDFYWCGNNVVDLSRAYYRTRYIASEAPKISDTVVNMDESFTASGITGTVDWGASVASAVSAYAGCEGITNINPGKELNIPNISGMFAGIHPYTEAPSFNLVPPVLGKKVLDASNLFSNTNISICNFIYKLPSSITNFSGMFSDIPPSFNDGNFNTRICPELVQIETDDVTQSYYENEFVNYDRMYRGVFNRTCNNDSFAHPLITIPIKSNNISMNDVFSGFYSSTFGHDIPEIKLAFRFSYPSQITRNISNHYVIRNFLDIATYQHSVHAYDITYLFDDDQDFRIDYAADPLSIPGELMNNHAYNISTGFGVASFNKKQPFDGDSPYTVFIRNNGNVEARSIIPTGPYWEASIRNSEVSLVSYNIRFFPNYILR